jgi:putative aldouronate transport system substrate-binding protein
MNATIMFDQNDPGARSFEENVWVKAYGDELNINLTYKWIASDEEANTAKWNAALASGDIPDFAYVNDSVYRLLYEADYLADMSAYLQGYGSEALLKRLTESDYQRMTLDGKLLGMPLPNKAYIGTTLLFVRKDWLDTLNLPVPKTIEDVISVARAFKDARLGGSDTIGILFNNNNSGGSRFVASDGKWDGFMNGFGAYLNYWLERDGKLVFSETQKEIKDALLAMHSLYKDGVMNRDIAVANSQIAGEYIAGGKAGLFYSTAWNNSAAMYTLHNNDPLSNVINLYPPAVQGRSFPIQTNSPVPRRIFVNKNTKYPEAVVKMANLTLKKQIEEYDDFVVGTNGMMYLKFMPWGDSILIADNDISLSYRIKLAEDKGESLNRAELAEFPGGYNVYVSFKQAQEGKYPFWRMTSYGPNSTYVTVYEAWKADNLLIDSYKGLPTQTQVLKETILLDQLHTAMYDVIRGADISVYDRAVEQWLANGGRQITDEVNRWYTGIKQ